MGGASVTPRQARAQQERRLFLLRELAPRPRLSLATRLVQALIWLAAIVVAMLVLGLVVIAGYFVFVLLNHFAGEVGW